MWRLTIYDSREDYICGTKQCSLHDTEEDAHEYMRGYGEYYDYDVEKINDERRAFDIRGLRAKWHDAEKAYSSFSSYMQMQNARRRRYSNSPKERADYKHLQELDRARDAAQSEWAAACRELAYA